MISIKEEINGWLLLLMYMYGVQHIESQNPTCMPKFKLSFY